MNKFYLIVLLVCFTTLADAQVVRPIETQHNAENTEIKVIKFYPNPATAFINFEFFKSVDRRFSLQVFNFIGKKVYELNTVSQKTTIPLAEFYRGVYIFKLIDKKGRIV